MNNTCAPQPSFYSVEDIQQIMGIGRSSAYKLVKSNGFPKVSIGNRIIIPADLFHGWVTKTAQGGAKNG